MTWPEIAKDLLMLFVGGGGVTILRFFLDKRKAKAEARDMEVSTKEKERKSVLDAYDSLEDAFFAQHEKIMELSAKLVQAQLLQNQLTEQKKKDV